MAELLKVDWVEEIRQRQQNEAASNERAALRGDLLNALAKAEGLQRFEGILKEIRLQAIAASEIGVGCQLTNVARDTDKEAGNHVFRIDVRSMSGRVASAYADLSYTEGDTHIRCFPSNTESFEIAFQLNVERKLTLLGPGGEIKSDAKAAKLVLFPLVKILTAE